jgi:hypothetical protein
MQEMSVGFEEHFLPVCQHTTQNLLNLVGEYMEALVGEISNK